MAGILKVDTIQRAGSDSDQITLSAGSVDLINPIIKSSDGTTAATVDSGGRIVQPAKPAWYFSVGDGISANNNLTADPVTWGYQVLSNGITIANNQTITVPTTGMYWISMGGIKGSSTGTASRMGMMLNTSTNTGIQLRGEENSAYAQMAGSFAISLTAGNTLHCYISGQGMWNGGSDALATNSPYWSGYLIG